MANYYGRTYDHTDPSMYGRSHERVDPSIHGRSYAGADPSLTYGGFGRTRGSDRSFGSYPAMTHATGWSTTKEYGMNGGNWHAQSATTAYDGRGFDEYVTKVAQEYIQPRGTASSASAYRHGLNPSGYSDYSSKETHKASGYPLRDGNYDSFSRKEYSSAVPTYASNSTSRPSHGSWNTSSGHSSQLSNPTNDIGAAMDYLYEASRTTAPGSRYAETTSRMHPHAENLEPVEPAKRYGSYNLFSRRSTHG